jgi:hypothetical protein
MARTKLNKLILKEIKKYLGIPYASNHWENLILIKEAIFGGKTDYLNIRYATKCAAEKEKINLKTLTVMEIYNLQKRHNIGIDCSGFVYLLLDKLDKLKGNAGILFKIIGADKPYGIYGIRSLSADELTQPLNSVKINNYEQIQTGDLIRFDQGKHVIFIISKYLNTIYYTHSSNKTKIRGVHQGQIKIVDPSKDLNYQTWSDTTLTDQPYSTLYFPQKGDGIYRPKCFI